MRLPDKWIAHLKTQPSNDGLYQVVDIILYDGTVKRDVIILEFQDFEVPVIATKRIKDIKVKGGL